MQLLKRKIDGFLAQWKQNPERKPLIVKGARQIGKTESIRAFGKKNYESVIEINFVLQKNFVPSSTVVTKSMPLLKTSHY